MAVRNPHLILVACLAVAILGTLSIIRLPKDLLPAANLPAVQILSFYSGMPVEHVEQNLTARFERYTGQAIGMERQESKSLVGVSIVRNFFNEETDLNTAIAQTTSLVMSVLRRLPPGTQPPLILPFDPMAAVPLGLVAVSGDFPEKELYDKARYDVGNAIQSVPGAMAPTVMGGAERQVVVFLDPKKLRFYNLSPLDVIENLSKLNTFIPTGDVKIDTFDYQIMSNGLVDKISQMDEFPLRSDNGVPVYLKDVGHASDANKIQTNIVRIDGKRQVYVPMYRQPGANSIRVVDEVKTSLRKLGERLKGFKLTLVADQSAFIRHAISSITEEALIGGGLAALMVLLFLGNPRATIGILLSLPLSLLCSFIGLKSSGQSINAMTLGGLALAIGVLVDNSIVVLENISKKIEAGQPIRQAALSGAAEVTQPVLASTLATLVVFFPVVFLSGVVKILFSALAKAVIFAMVGSFLTAMTVMPLFGSYVLRVVHTHELPAVLRWPQTLISRLTRVYGRSLEDALRFRGTLIAGSLGLLALGGLLAPDIGTELFPRADAGNFVLELRLKSGTRIEETERFAATIEKKLHEWISSEDLAMVITNAGVYYGFPAAFTPNSGPQDVFFNVELTEERKHTSQYYAKILRERIPKEFPGTEMGIELGGLLTSALNGGLRSPINVQVEGPEFQESHRIAQDLVERIVPLPGAVDVRVQERLDAPQIELDVDRKKAGLLGLTTDEVVKNVVSAVSGSSTFNSSIWVDPKSGIDYLLGVQFTEDAVSSLDQLSDIPITGRRQDREVPLRSLANIDRTVGPSEANHVNLRPVTNIYLDAQGRDIGGLSRDVQKTINHFNLPSGYTASIRGEISEMNKSVSTLGGGFLLAAVLVYLILVVQFRSFVLPAIIMVSVPIGLVGIVIMFIVTHTYFSIQAAIGAIFMIGIAVANGVLLIEFISHHHRSGRALDHSIVEGAQARFRPILMTSLASILGLVPMAIGFGHGSEANIPLGRAVIGGQLLSTALTLFLVPVLYRVLMSRTTVNVGSAQ
jgi:multidrug efflux pump subunit AcrB